MKGEYRYLIGNILLYVLFDNGRTFGHPLIMRQTANIPRCELLERSVKSASGSAVVLFSPVRVSICETGFMGPVKRASIVVQLYMRVLSLQKIASTIRSFFDSILQMNADQE